MLDSFDAPAWVEGMIQRIVNGDSAYFALVVLKAAGDNYGFRHRNARIYSAFDRVDSRLFGRDPDPFSPKNVASLLSNAQTLIVSPIAVGDVSVLKEPDAIEIRKFHLDLLIKVGFEFLQCDNLRVSKFGIWYYYHGDDRVMRGGPPGFWEVVENKAETGASLLATGCEEFACQRVLYRSFFFTYPLSPARHRSYYFWAAASFMPRQLEYLQRFGKERFLRQTERFNTLPACDAKRYETPKGFAAIKTIVKIMIRLLGEFFKRIFYLDQWYLLAGFGSNLPKKFGGFEKLMPPGDRFWADPHIVQVHGRYYIFIEEFLHTQNRGRISVIEADQFGRWKKPVVALEKEYHLSYPFVLHWQGKFYMIPESGENRTIDIYECVEFPDKWEFKQSLMRDVKAVDSTLLHHAGKWWLFTAIAENEAAAPNYELFLFYADDLFAKEWKSHPQNPVVSDIKSARPAGDLFIEDGRLFRPSQDCSRMYGYGFDFNEIEVLSETEYSERRVSSIRPTWDKNVLATHTYSHQGNLMVIDAFRRKQKFWFS